jgi:hypothetical protein
MTSDEVENEDDSLPWESWELLPYLLSFVTDDSGSFISIHADLNGVSALIDLLLEIKQQLEQNDCPHTHLFPRRGYGPYLTTTKLENHVGEINVAHQVKIYGWNDEWAVRHGLRPPAPPQQDRGWKP